MGGDCSRPTGRISVRPSWPCSEGPKQAVRCALFGGKLPNVPTLAGAEALWMLILRAESQSFPGCRATVSMGEEILWLVSDNPKVSVAV